MTAALLLAGCLRATRYEPVSFVLEPVSEAFVADLPRLIDADLASGRLRGISPPPGELPDEALYALYACVRPWTRGAELDLLVDIGDGPRPVSVTITRDRHATVAWSAAEVQRVGAPHDLDLVDGDVRWTEAEIGDVAVALAVLSDAERSVLSGVELVRVSRSPRAPRSELAWFDPTVEPPRIELFDLAFANDHVGFVGPVEAPRPSGAMTVLHEVGHVLADAPMRRAYATYLEAWQGAAGEAVAKDRYRAYRALGSRGPVIEAWEAFRGRTPGPTTYGMRSQRESFAEAFALYHLDPDALDRVLPGATAWFRAGTHLRAAGVADPE